MMNGEVITCGLCGFDYVHPNWHNTPQECLDTAHAKVRALEAELRRWADDCTVHIESNLKLEAELAELKAPNGIVQYGKTLRGYIETRKETPTATWYRAEKAEAEVERLRKEINRCLAFDWHSIQSGGGNRVPWKWQAGCPDCDMSFLLPSRSLLRAAIRAHRATHKEAVD